MNAVYVHCELISSGMALSIGFLLIWGQGPGFEEKGTRPKTPKIETETQNGKGWSLYLVFFSNPRPRIQLFFLGILNLERGSGSLNDGTTLVAPSLMLSVIPLKLRSRFLSPRP